MDLNNHSPSNDQGADRFGLDPQSDEPNMVNDNIVNANSHSEQKSENVQPEQTELTVSSRGSNAVIQSPESAPDSVAAVGSPPRPEAEDETSTDVSDDINAAEDTATIGNSSVTDPPISTPTLEVDADSDTNPNGENGGEGSKSVEAEVGEPSGDEDEQETIDRQASGSPDEQVDAHHDIFRYGDNNATHEFTFMLDRINAVAAAQPKHHNNNNNNVVTFNDDVANLTANSSSGPQPLINSPVRPRYSPIPFTAALLQPLCPASPASYGSATNSWQNSNRIASLQQLIHPSNPLSPRIGSPNFGYASSTTAPLPIFSVGMSSGYDVGQVQTQTFGRYEQPNQAIYYHQHTNASSRIAENLHRYGINSAPITSHQYSGANNYHQTVQNMTSGGFSLGNTQHRHQPMFSPCSFPPGTMMTSAGIGVPNQGFTHLINRVTYWRHQQQLSNSYQSQQLSNQNASSVGSNSVVYDLNVPYANNQARTVPMRPRNASPPYQQQVNRQAPAVQDANVSLGAILRELETTLIGHGRNYGELGEVVTPRNIPQQRRSTVVPRPANAILSRAVAINDGDRLRRFVNGSASSTNANHGTNSSHVNALNSQANQGRIIMIETPGRFSRQRQYDIGESSSSSSKRAKIEVEAQNRDSSESSDGRGIMPENFRAGLQVPDDNNHQSDLSSVASSEPDNPRTIPMTNSVYDPEYERMGLPIDPHLRMFALSNWNKDSK